MLKLYESRLGWTLPVVPTVLMAYADTPGQSRYRGDVSAGWIMALRFQGHAWQERGPDDTYDIVHLIAHEGFHLWNGMMFNSRQITTQPCCMKAAPNTPPCWRCARWANSPMRSSATISKAASTGAMPNSAPSR